MPDKAKPDDPAQSQRFIDMAKEVEAETDDGVFEENFTKIRNLERQALKKP